MPVTHMNRKGKTFYLHEGVTSKGNPKFFFSTKSEGRLAARVPEGFEVYENPNARVFLRKARPRLITDEETRFIEQEMKRHPHLRYCRCDTKDNLITVFEPNQDVEGLAELLTRFGTARPSQVAETVEQTLSYLPMLRFALVDPQSRTFQAQRFCFLGSIDDWIEIGSPGSLETLARTFVKHLGEDTFFDLI